VTRPALHIVDAVLAEQDAERLLAWLETVRYRSVHHEGWRTVWRLLEGSPLRGPTWIAGGERNEEMPPALIPLVTALTEIALRDRPGYQVSITPWLYPVGTALGLHQDDGDYDGAFVFYLTREWDVHWGGLLSCVTELQTARPSPRAILDPGRERASVAGSGQGQWVAPAWNRLVLIAPQVRHFISRVDAAAGDRVRITLGGFFHPQTSTGAGRIRRSFANVGRRAMS